MLYKNSKEYEHTPIDPELGILQSWLNGEVGIEGLREWLRGRYGKDSGY